jgi:hypothetical protein
MTNNSFKVSAELLQKNAMKAAIRDLNAEFQMKGGKVTPSKKGDTYQLSHPDDGYLEEFRLRLFKELGLVEEKDLPKELKGPQAAPPRYGDRHQLRRGWNVRSDKEKKEGIFDKEDRMAPEGNGYKTYEDRQSRFNDRRPYRDDRRDERPRREGPRSPYHGQKQFRDRKSPAPHQPETTPPEDEGTRSFEERWGDIKDYMAIIEDALKNGAVDDGMIIKFAYNREMPEDNIKKLKKLLWDNRCRGPRENCPHGKKKLRFEDMMKVCSGRVEGWQNIDSPFLKFLDLWKDNMEKMYGPFRDKMVEVEGKISSYKPVYRKGHEHLKILVYDTKVSEVNGKGDPSDTRKLWIKITVDEFQKILGERKIHLEDVIKFIGKCVYDKYFHDYWVIDISSMEVVEDNGGEAISAVL